KWWGANPMKKREEEIDIVGLGEEDILFAECKYTNEKIGIDVYEKLKERSHLILCENPYYYLFSKNGFKENLIEIEKVTKNLKLITLDSMIKEI
ncbi:MAG: DUF234 domain-containing protein, partial [Bacillota bacterium]|nr:DUF234 domain-containing protein [Bacillota bacterium]